MVGDHFSGKSLYHLMATNLNNNKDLQHILAGVMGSTGVLYRSEIPVGKGNLMHSTTTQIEHKRNANSDH